MDKIDFAYLSDSGNLALMQNFIRQHPHMITIVPNREAKKAIKVILDRFDTALPICIDNSSWSITDQRIFCDNESISVSLNDFTYTCKLEAGTDYKEEFSQEDVKLTRNNYKSYVRRAFAKATLDAVNKFRTRLRKETYEAKVYKEDIKNCAASFKSFNNAVKEFKEFIKDKLPEKPEWMTYFIAGAGEVMPEAGHAVVQLVAFKDIIQKIKKTKDTLQYIKEGQRAYGKDFNVMNRLVKSRKIEKFGYNKRDGLYWIYPPRIYPRESSKMGFDVFLGRVKVVCNTVGFSLGLLSYDEKGEGHIYGTWHFHNDPYSYEYCLGEFDDAVRVLLARKDVVGLVNLLDKYIDSGNPDSKLCTPAFQRMKMDGKHLIDDSLKVYNENKAKA